MYYGYPALGHSMGHQPQGQGHVFCSKIQNKTSISFLILDIFLELLKKKRVFHIIYVRIFEIFPLVYCFAYGQELYQFSFISSTIVMTLQTAGDLNNDGTL